MKILEDPITVAALAVASVALILILLGCVPQRTITVEIPVPQTIEKQIVVTATPSSPAPRFPEGTYFAINDASNFIFQVYDAKYVVGQYFYVLVMVKADKSPELVGTFWEYPVTDAILQEWINSEEIRVLDLETY